jgi:hypothetical protein
VITRTPRLENPQAGQPAVLFVNRSKSHALASRAGPPRANVGFNGWRRTLGELQLQPAKHVDADLLERDAAAAAGSSGSGGSGSASGGGAAGPAAPAAEDRWYSVSFVVPDDAYEMQFALTDGRGVWDNNDGGRPGRGGRRRAGRFRAFACANATCTSND